MRSVAQAFVPVLQLLFSSPGFKKMSFDAGSRVFLTPGRIEQVGMLAKKQHRQECLWYSS